VPPDELHELGARMVTDFFALAGFEATFVGASTPIEDFVAALRHIRPRYVAVSVTNPYNLIALRKLIERIRGKVPRALGSSSGAGPWPGTPSSPGASGPTW